MGRVHTSPGKLSFITFEDKLEVLDAQLCGVQPYSSHTAYKFLSYLCTQ